MAIGASPADWTRLSQAGLTADLLPVVSDTTAPIHPQSKLKELGKTPSRFDGDGYAVGIPGWTKTYATERDVKRWSEDARLGICIQTRLVRAIDIDVNDARISSDVRSLAEMLLGRMPTRWRSNSGKQLLAFTMEGTYSKRIIRSPHGLIEFLANGQQFVAHGTHPSGARYEWEGLDLLDALGEFPRVLPDEFETLWESLSALYGPSVTDKAGMAPTAARRAQDAKDDVVDYLEREGWVRGWSPDGKVYVRCPWISGHSSDSGETESTWFPAGVGGFANGHYKCLHASCAHRTDEQFLEVIGFTASHFEVLPVARAGDAGAEGEAGEGAETPLPKLQRDRSGRIEPTISNALAVVRHGAHIGLKVAHDNFKATTLVAWDGASEWRPIGDNDLTACRERFEMMGFKSAGKEMARDAVLKVAEEKAFDSAIEWAKALVWDGKPRVRRFMVEYMGAEDTPYAESVGLYLWTALAARLMCPGHKCDMVPVFVGKQGTGKSTAVAAMAPEPDAYVEVNLEHRDDNLARSLRGKLIGELGELRGLMSREAEAIKAWITRTHEEWIPKYVEFATKFPRRLAFVGTTNSDEFLADSTGERRWLPIWVGLAHAIRVAAIEADRNQLWAEALALFAEGGLQWRDAQALAEAEHEHFKVRDEWAGPVRQWLLCDDMGGCNLFEKPSMLQIAQGALGFSAQKFTKSDERRLGAVLRSLGLEKGRATVRGERIVFWEPAENCKLIQCADIC